MSGIYTTTRLIRDPVPTSAALPIGSDIVGAIRVVLSDYSVWVYTGTAWQQAGGGSVPLGALDNSTIYLNSSSKVAIKPLGITDDLINGASSILRNWSSTVAYTVGQMVVSSNAIWLAVASSTNSTPANANTNWKKIADVSSGTSMIYSPVATSSFTIPVGEYSSSVDTTSATVNVFLPLLSSLTNAPYTTDRVQAFYIFKVSQLNAMVIRCSGSDEFIDGVNSFTINGQGVFVCYAQLQINRWVRG